MAVGKFAKDLAVDDRIDFTTADGKRHRITVKRIRYREVIVRGSDGREYEFAPHERIALRDDA